MSTRESELFDQDLLLTQDAVVEFGFCYDIQFVDVSSSVGFALEALEVLVGGVDARVAELVAAVHLGVGGNGVETFVAED